MIQNMQFVGQAQSSTTKLNLILKDSYDFCLITIEDTRDMVHDMVSKMEEFEVLAVRKQNVRAGRG